MKKNVSKAIENDAKEQKGTILSMLSDPLTASLLGNILASNGVIWAGKRTIRIGQDF